MPFAGIYSPPPNPGEAQPFSLDFSAQILTGEQIASVTSSLTLKSGVDAAVASRLIGAPSFSGSVCSQTVGNMVGGATYILTFTALMSSGRVLQNYAYIPCQAVD
jgi:hypothetical protein